MFTTYTLCDPFPMGSSSFQLRRMHISHVHRSTGTDAHARTQDVNPIFLLSLMISIKTVHPYACPPVSNIFYGWKTIVAIVGIGGLNMPMISHQWSFQGNDTFISLLRNKIHHNHLSLYDETTRFKWLPAAQIERRVHTATKICNHAVAGGINSGSVILLNNSTWVTCQDSV